MDPARADKPRGYEQTRRVRLLSPLSFPVTRDVLWDHSAAGDVMRLSLFEGRSIRVGVAEQAILLAANCTLDVPRQCRLLGTVHMRDDGQEILFDLAQFDATDGTDSSHQDVGQSSIQFSVPLTVAKKAAKLSDAELQMHMETSVMVLKSRATSHQPPVCSAAFLPLRGYAYCCQSTAGVVEVELEFDLTVHGTVFKITPVAAVPVADTALSMSLMRETALAAAARNASCGAPKTGYLTMDQTRKLVFMLESDPKAFTLPLVGVWVKGVDVVTHPFVWAACFHYLFDSAIGDKACGSCHTGRDAFLVALLPTAGTGRPLFYDCNCSEGECISDIGNVPNPLSHKLLTATLDHVKDKALYCNPSRGALYLDLCVVHGGARMQTFTAAVGAASCPSSDPSSEASVSNCSSSYRAPASPVGAIRHGSDCGAAVRAITAARSEDDAVPRMSPLPHSAKTAAVVAPSVPDVSLILEEDVPVVDASRHASFSSDNAAVEVDDGTVPYRASVQARSTASRAGQRSDKQDSDHQRRGVGAPGANKKVAFTLPPPHLAHYERPVHAANSGHTSPGLPVRSLAFDSPFASSRLCAELPSAQSCQLDVSGISGCETLRDRYVASAPHSAQQAVVASSAMPAKLAAPALASSPVPFEREAPAASAPHHVYELLQRQDEQLRVLQEQISRLLQSQKSQNIPAEANHSSAVARSIDLQARASQQVATVQSWADSPKDGSANSGRVSAVPNSAMLSASANHLPSAQRAAQCTVAVNTSNSLCYPAAGRPKKMPVAHSATDSARESPSSGIDENNADEDDLGSLCAPPVLQETQASFASSALMLEMPSYTSSITKSRLEESSECNSILQSVSDCGVERATSESQQRPECGSCCRHDTQVTMGNKPDQAYYTNLIKNVKDLLARHDTRTPSMSPTCSGDQDVGNDELKSDVALTSPGCGGSNGRNRGRTAAGAQTSNESPSSDAVAGTMRQHMRTMGIDVAEPPARGAVVDPLTVLLPKIEYTSVLLSADEQHLSSDKSVEFNALAMKYLGDHQLTQYARLAAAAVNGLDSCRRREDNQHGASSLLRAVLARSGTLTSNFFLSDMSAVSTSNGLSFASTKYMRQYGLLEPEQDESSAASGTRSLRLGTDSCRRPRQVAPGHALVMRDKEKENTIPSHTPPAPTMREQADPTSDDGRHAHAFAPVCSTQPPDVQVLAGLPKAQRRLHPRPLAMLNANSLAHAMNDTSPYEPVKVLDMDKLRELPKLL